MTILQERMRSACEPRNLLQIPADLLRTRLHASQLQLQEVLVHTEHQTLRLEWVERQNILQFLVCVDVCRVKDFAHRVVVVELLFELCEVGIEY